MALAPRAPFGGAWAPLMAEHFATTADVYRLTGELPPDADLHPAADGADKTIAGSARRLARMIGRDAEAAPLARWRQLALWFEESQLQHIAAALARALSRGLLDDAAPLLGAGVGRFLVARLALRLRRPYRDFAELIPDASAAAGWASACAPAVAVAWLLRGRTG
jgi:probable H4MPT-linked C1 transfer pathway protein